MIAAMRRRSVKAPAAEAIAPVPDSVPPASRQERRSPARIAEEEAIAAFLKDRGITICPPTGSAEIMALAPLVRSKERRRWHREQAGATA